MRVLVCGDRRWNDAMAVFTLLTVLWTKFDLVIIEGGAKGADTVAADWADNNEVEHLRFPADWATHKKAAGPIRNQQMLDEGHPDLILAFHDNLKESKGTGDMVRRSRKAGLPVLVFSHRA